LGTTRSGAQRMCSGTINFSDDQSSGHRDLHMQQDHPIGQVGSGPTAPPLPVASSMVGMVPVTTTAVALRIGSHGRSGILGGSGCYREDLPACPPRAPSGGEPRVFTVPSGHIAAYRSVANGDLNAPASQPSAGAKAPRLILHRPHIPGISATYGPGGRRGPPAIRGTSIRCGGCWV